MRTGFLALLAGVALCPPAPAQQPKPEPKYEGKPLAYWVERFQKAENEKDRNEAATAIGAFGVDGAPAVPALMVMLEDRSASYRGQVAQILCEIGPGAKSAVPVLLKRLKEKYAAKPREGKEIGKFLEVRELIEILGAIGPDAKEAMPTLTTLLEDADYARPAIDALCNIGPDAKEAIPKIRRVMLEEWPGGMKRGYYARHLLKLGPETTPLLVDLLGRPDRYDQAMAFEALGKLDPAAIKGSPQLARLLQAPDPVARYYASVLVWKVEKNKAAVPVLVALLKEEGRLSENGRPWEWGDYVAFASAKHLGDIGPDAKDALPALREAVAIRFLIWYFAGSQYERRVSGVPSAMSIVYRAYGLSERVAVGQAALEALQKIAPER